MQVLLILNDPPYGTERCYNGLRLALALAKSAPAITVKDKSCFAASAWMPAALVMPRC